MPRSALDPLWTRRENAILTCCDRDLGARVLARKCLVADPVHPMVASEVDPGIGGASGKPVARRRDYVKPDPMTLRIQCLCIDSNDPSGLASFWQSALGWRR